MSNRLAEASSPYLLQHQNNPVDWYPWGDAAFELARRDVRTILDEAAGASAYDDLIARINEYELALSSGDMDKAETALAAVNERFDKDDVARHPINPIF